MAQPDPRGRRRARGAPRAQVLAALHQAGGPVPAGPERKRPAAGPTRTTLMTAPGRPPAKDAVTRRREGRSFGWLPRHADDGN
ncbi:hypothetical protein ABZ619_03045 [Streptomyces sp. NPDC007851]|uniref:hypothetical protein n=1 Tax=Streptomyces sp. NPDC007851 TaxID=3155008 RepID=UPI003402C534